MKPKLFYPTCRACSVLVFLLILLVPLVSAACTGISKTNWQLVSVDSQELVAENGAAVNAFDNDPNTIWHSQWKNAAPAHPHEIIIDLGAAYLLDGFSVLPRQDGNTNGRIIKYAFYAGASSTQWETAAASGRLANTAVEQSVSLEPTNARYIRLVALSALNGRPWTSLAEIGVTGTPAGAGNQAPNGTITSPADNLTIQVGDPVNFGGAGSDPDNNLPLTYLWQFGAGSGIANYTAGNTPGNVTFNHAGIYTVTFTVTDALGAADPTPDTRVVTVTDSSADDDQDSDGLPDSWELQYGTLSDLDGRNGDADGDGVSNWVEYKLGTDPTVVNDKSPGIYYQYDELGRIRKLERIPSR